MCEYTELYPTVCIGRILTYPLYGSPQDHHQRAFDVHSGNQSSRLVAQVQRVHKGHTMTYALLLSQVYIPAISSALDIHLRIIQNVGGYYTILNTFPLPSTQVNIMDVKKTVTLILVDGIYKPVVPKRCTPEQRQDQEVPVPEPKCNSEEKKRKIEYTEEKEKGKEIGLPQTECKSPEKQKRKIEEEKEEYKQVEVDQLKGNSTPK